MCNLLPVPLLLQVHATPQLSFVNSYEDYVDDAMTFVRKVIPSQRQRLYIFGASMGGMVASLAAARCPNDFDGVILNG
jgi:alpha-beta hydrolase superfamily lysophospholipase